MKIVAILLLVISNLVASEIPLVWQCGRSGMWEEDWLKEVLSDVKTINIDDDNFEKFVDNSIVVISSGYKSDEFANYFAKMHKRGFKYGIILLSDELYHVPHIQFEYASFIFRNYWKKEYTKDERVLVFPLGYGRGFWKDCDAIPRPASDREYVWSFVGQICYKPTREMMIDALKVVPHYKIHETTGWGITSPQAMPVTEYRDLLFKTLFVPCPKGWWNIDSFRLSESLECGCIPIVETFPFDYFKKFYGPNPFLKVNSWEEAPALIDALMADPEALERKRVECYEWWQSYKANMKDEMTKIIKKTFKG